MKKVKLILLLVIKDLQIKNTELTNSKIKLNNK